MDTFKAYYVGENEDGVEAFGTKFEHGKATDVDEKFKGKLEGNPHFNTDGKGAKEAKKAAQSRHDAQTLTAIHKGGGSYSIIDGGGKELIDKLTKSDADTFNAMSDEDKAAYVSNAD